MRQWEQSGQSVRAYCRQTGLKESAFYFWRRELARRDRPVDRDGSRAKTPASRSVQRRLPRHSPTPSFLPVHVVNHGVAEATRGVEIVLAGGRTVRVTPGFDRQMLADVLAVLEVGRPQRLPDSRRCYPKPDPMRGFRPGHTWQRRRG